MTARDIEGRYWRTSDEVRPGPSPWYVCATCGLTWRRLAFIVPDNPCPMCGCQPTGVPTVGCQPFAIRTGPGVSE